VECEPGLFSVFPEGSPEYDRYFPYLVEQSIGISSYVVRGTDRANERVGVQEGEIDSVVSFVEDSRRNTNDFLNENVVIAENHKKNHKKKNSGSTTKSDKVAKSCFVGKSDIGPENTNIGSRNKGFQRGKSNKFDKGKGVKRPRGMLVGAADSKNQIRKKSRITPDAGEMFHASASVFRDPSAPSFVTGLRLEAGEVRERERQREGEGERKSDNEHVVVTMIFLFHYFILFCISRIWHFITIYVIKTITV